MDGRCEPTGSDTRMVPHGIVSASACFNFFPEQAATCPVDEGALVETQRGNWVDLAYPPLFYQAMSFFVGPDMQTSVLMMRAVNIALHVAVAIALFLLLPRALRPPLIWGMAISIVPLGMFLVASVNPSAWALTSASGLWLAALGWFSQSGWRRWGLGALATVLLIIGAGARADAAVYSVLALLAAAVLAFRATRRYAALLLLPAVLSIMAVVAFLSTGQSQALDSGASETPRFPFSTLVFLNLRTLPDLWVGVFGDFGIGGLGWLDTDMPGTTSLTAGALFAALAFWGLRRGDARKWLALAGIGLSLVVLPMYMLVLNDALVGEWVQPRYIYPLIIMFGGIALTGFPRPALGLRRMQLVVIGVGLAVANSLGLHANMRRYITGTDVSNFNLDAAREWWWNAPITPMAVWLAGSLCFALALAVLVWVAERASAAEPAAGASPAIFGEQPRPVPKQV